MSLVLQSSGGGSVTIAEPTTASNFTQTLPAATGEVMVSGNMPAFSAKLSGNQNISNNTVTVLAADLEDFDTASCYNNTGSTIGGIPAYAFLPNVAGYYQINFMLSEAGVAVSYNDSRINKNGSIYRFGTIVQPTSATFSTFGATGSAIIYMNGTTDYLQIAGYITAASSNNFDSNSHWSGCLVRAA
jgi:hypothetical protein